LEQPYPFPTKDIQKVLTRYNKTKEIVWLQEEPENQGSWWAIRNELNRFLQPHQTLSYVGRQSSAAPAVGYPSLFRKQQDQIIHSALDIKD
jgi:2-oxoglutarate dehydrogenase E1 component